METQQQEYESLPIWRNYVDDDYELYYVDYRDDLSEQKGIIEECVRKNNLCPISEKIDEWWEYPEGYQLDEIKKNMENDGFGYVYDECQDYIREWLWEHDTSDPVKDLLRNTGGMTFFYDLGIEVDGWHEAFLCSPWRGETEAQAAYKIRRKLGIKKGTKEARYIDQLVANASYGGHLRIYFNADLENLVDGYDGSHNAKTIVFKGRFAVAVYDPVNGSGDYQDMNIDCSFAFNRDNLFLSCKSVERYTIEDCFGMSDGWAEEYNEPTFSAKPSKHKTRTSSTSAIADQEAEYERVFKAGGCTCGDTNLKRHRNVHYINMPPCRLECPHCGQEWID